MVQAAGRRDLRLPLSSGEQALMAKEESNEFGRHLRAVRLGYWLDPVLEAWARVSTRQAGGFLVELVPRKQLVPQEMSPTGKHLVWWHKLNTCTKFSEPLRAMGILQAPARLELDDYGEVIK